MYESRNIRAVIHDDDFTLLALEEELDWFRVRIAERFEFKFKERLGPGRKDDKSFKILDRVLLWTPEGIRHEPDQRHADRIIMRLGLAGEEGISTPGVKPVSSKDEEEDDELIDAQHSIEYRRIVARRHYLTQE